MPATDLCISMCKGVLNEHMSAHYVHSDAQGDQKKALDFLELELQTVATCHGAAGNQTWVLWKSSQCF